MRAPALPVDSAHVDAPPLRQAAAVSAAARASSLRTPGTVPGSALWQARMQGDLPARRAERRRRARQDGGFWINLGPLLYHWADAHTYLPEDELSVEVRTAPAAVPPSAAG